MTMLKEKRYLYLITLLLIAVAGIGVVWLFGGYNTKHIWVIHSHDEGYEQYEEYNRKLIRELRNRGVNAHLSFSYLNCNKYIEIHEDSIMKHWIDSVEQHHRWPDLIITTEDQATFALLSTHRPALRRCPILFGGVRFPNYKLLKQYDNVTGIRDTVDFIKSMEVLHELTGELHAYTNLDQRFFDRQVERLILDQMKGHPILNNLHWENRIKRLYSLPADSMSITGLSMRSISSNTTKGDATPKGESKDQMGNENFFWTLGPQGLMHYLLLKFDATSHTLAIMSLRSQFTGINNLFGNMGIGFLAGYFSSIDTWAKEQAAVAKELLNGTPPAEIPVSVSPKDYYVDWNVAQKFGIPLEKIPAKYHLVNIPYSTLHPYIYWCFMITFYGLLIGGLCVAVTLAVRATRMKLKALNELQEKQTTLEIASTFNQSFVWRTNKELLELDDAFWRFIGKEPHIIPGIDFLRWVHPDFHQGFAEKIAHNISTENIVYQMQCNFSNSEEEYSWWEVRAKGEWDSHGNFKRFGLLFNIDSIKQREAELIQARKRMEEADLKESFLANMSHEIRTPLNAIVGFSNILATPGMELEDEEKEDMMETINKNNEILLKLVNDILDISRIESGYMDFRFEQIKIEDLMNGIHQSYSVQAPQHLEFIYRPGAEEYILFIDQMRAQQVVMNFLTNAAKFTPKGSITLGWEYHKESKEVEIYVQDTGIGLSEDDCLLIFNRFFKKNEFKQGTGLGLAICRVIAERLHGRITVNSKLHQGSRFSLWLKVV